MAEKTTIARPYAKAAFEEAKADKHLAEWSQMLRAAATAGLTSDARFDQDDIRAHVSRERQLPSFTAPEQLCPGVST